MVTLYNAEGRSLAARILPSSKVSMHLERGRLVCAYVAERRPQEMELRSTAGEPLLDVHCLPAARIETGAGAA